MFCSDYVKWLMTALATLANLANAQTAPLANGEVVACEALDCPHTAPARNDSAYDCHAAGLDFRGLGVASYTSDLVDSPPTWTVGVSAISLPNQTNVYNFTRTFFIGTDAEDIDDGIEGCALFFLAEDDNGNPNPIRPEPPDSWEGSQCAQPNGLGDNCVPELERLASEAALIDGATCSTIAAALDDGSLDGCFMGQSIVVHSVPLTGSEAPAPINTAQNASSNCWPTLPKSNQLVSVFDFNITLLVSEEAISNADRWITPMMSVWWNGAGAADANLLCIQPQSIIGAYSEKGASAGGGASLLPVPLLISVFGLLAVVGSHVL
ncbi:hypothetical protein B0A50_05809 [Salinomyces thailandicus]|uniref:Uncharacterized protein n=1 Tax=Salinomyces thailandicus TaxID=706561 RepID=A0A4U0TU32_9PEZI|nr:hypothetical protein B0A50_05809 [Salinomyces thailandica]